MASYINVLLEEPSIKILIKSGCIHCAGHLAMTKNSRKQKRLPYNSHEGVENIKT